MGSDVNVLTYLKVLDQRKVIIVATLFLVLVFTFIFTSLQPKIYVARTTFYFPGATGGGGGGNVALGGVTFSLGSLPTFSGPSQMYVVAIMKSRAMAEQVVDAIGGEELFKAKKKDAASAIMGSSDTRLTKEGIYEITVTYTQPEIAAKIANGFISAYQEYTEKNVLTQAKKHRRFAESQMKKVEARLRKAEKVLEEYQKREGSMNVASSVEAHAGLFARLKTDRLLNQAELASFKTEEEAQRSLYIGQLTRAQREFLLAPLSKSSAAAELHKELVKLELDLLRAREGATDANPQIKVLKSKLAKTRELMKQQIESELGSLKSSETDALIGLEAKKLAFLAKEAAYETLMKNLDREFVNLPAKALEFFRLERNVKVQESLYTMLVTEYEKARLVETKEGAELQLLDPALPPESPSRPVMSTNLLMGGILGLFLGLVAAFVWEYLEGLRKPRIPQNLTVSAPRE
ncbi:MAG: hypothetical protein HYU64_14705 [Armatimonadetes bacterium]|nr:hypothetical protein [Armatimonadota bacterium]